MPRIGTVACGVDNGALVSPLSIEADGKARIFFYEIEVP